MAEPGNQEQQVVKPENNNIAEADVSETRTTPNHPTFTSDDSNKTALDAVRKDLRRESGIGRFKRLINSSARTLSNEFGGPKKLSPELINDNTISYLIWKHLKNPVSGTKPGEIPFSITDVMANSGYVKPSLNSDYMKGFPQIYPRYRQALANLARDGVLEMSALEEPDAHGETIYYSIPKGETGTQRQAELETRARKAQEANPDLRYI